MFRYYEHHILAFRMGLSGAWAWDYVLSRAGGLEEGFGEVWGGILRELPLLRSGNRVVAI
jgi:hypothetical protein